MTNADLRGLREKYEQIAALRARATKDATRPDAELQALASRFPGALRELDALPPDVVAERIAHLAAVEAGTTAAGPWVEAQFEFHRLLRGALCAKRWLAGRREVHSLDVDRFRRDAATLCYGEDALRWSENLVEIANPPRGRLVELIVQRVATATGLSLTEVRELVLPVSRPTAPSK